MKDYGKYIKKIDGIWYFRCSNTVIMEDLGISDTLVKKTIKSFVKANVWKVETIEIKKGFKERWFMQKKD